MSAQGVWTAADSGDVEGGCSEGNEGVESVMQTCW